ncbi:MAG: TetR/AcrR family transcriptional regulator, cholesterol catabolism regulator [Actinomycetota bacterium]|jgi:AcrR family transcriptional regulator|nr:TetR/AcrR family transcriptional regulator, cholesterol catabolism regulator [Actinomycetota bacterium]
MSSSNISRRRAAALDEGGAAYRERRAEIIRAAGEVFKRLGFRGTKIGDIAEAVSMDRATIYYYAGSKEELFHQAVGDAVERNCLHAEAILTGPGTPTDKLRTLVTDLMVSYADSYPYLYLYIQEDLGPSANRSQWGRTMARFNKRYENAVVAIVEDGVADGSFHVATEPWVIAYGILGMVAWSNRWFNPETSSVPAREIGAAYAETVVRGLVR